MTTIVICYLPFVLGADAGVLGFLPQYAKEEGLQSGERYYLLDLIDYILDWCGVVHDLPPRQSGQADPAWLRRKRRHRGQSPAPTGVGVTQ